MCQSQKRYLLGLVAGDCYIWYDDQVRWFIIASLNSCFCLMQEPLSNCCCWKRDANNWIFWIFKEDWWLVWRVKWLFLFLFYLFMCQTNLLGGILPTSLRWIKSCWYSFFCVHVCVHTPKTSPRSQQTVQLLIMYIYMCSLSGEIFCFKPREHYQLFLTETSHPHKHNPPSALELGSANASGSSPKGSKLSPG